MRKISTLLLILLSSANIIANAQHKPLFDGGMMLHAGIMNGTITALDYSAEGMTYGIGGVLRFHIGHHLRVGGEGYVSTLNQMDNGSYIKLGWGGAVVDGRWTFGRWTPYAGLTIGGGSASSLLMFSGEDSDWISESDAILHNERFMMIDPYVGIEYALTDAVHLTLKADRMIPLSGESVPAGIRGYIGFIFCH